MQSIKIFEEECINGIRAINDARASDDYGCVSIKYLLHLIKIAVNKYKNIYLTVKLFTGLLGYMPEYKIRRYSINTFSKYLDKREEVSCENKNEKVSEDDLETEELSNDSSETEEDSDNEKILYKSIKRMNPLIKECEEAVLFDFNIDRRYDDISERINYLTDLIEKCIDNYEDPDIILRLCTVITEYVKTKHIEHIT